MAIQGPTPVVFAGNLDSPSLATARTWHFCAATLFCAVRDARAADAIGGSGRSGEQYVAVPASFIVRFRSEHVCVERACPWLAGVRKCRRCEGSGCDGRFLWAFSGWKVLRSAAMCCDDD